MTFAEVEELFIRAAFIERKMMRESVLPSGGSPWPRYHHEASDIEGWSKKDRDAYARKLAQNGGSYGDARRSREAIDMHAKASELIVLVSDEGERRALLHWAMAKAGGIPFKRFCEAENIHEETGRRWKKQAIGEIVAKDQSNGPLDSGNDDYAVLPEPPENGHKTPTLAADATTRIRAERDHQTQAARDTILSGWKASRTAWRRKVHAAR